MTETAGLRERKKARTRWAIQEQALRLFAQQGYAATTIDQIAAAADISPSTFFRYFATKEDVVVQDEFDELFVAAFAQAAGSPRPARAFREIIVGAMAQLPEDEWERSAQRMRLTMSEPSLRARSVDNLLTVSARAAAALAEATGRPAEDAGVTALAGACMGVLSAVALGAGELGTLAGFRSRLDEALSRLDDVDWFADDRAPR